MTILEVVLAVFLLGLVAASIAGAINASNAMEARNRMTVAAHELGNRLVLTWLDDETRMPAASAPLDYGDHRFFWDKKLQAVRMRPNQHQQSGTPNLNGLDRFRMLTVNIYAADDSDSGTAQRAEALATITRIYDPMAPRNADSMNGLEATPGRIPTFIRRLLTPGSDLDP